MQAIERLHVNQMLSSVSVDCLEKTLSDFRQNGVKRASYALLVTQTKLLSMFCQ